MGLELIDPSGSVVAEVFKCDSSKKVIVTTFNNDIPLEISIITIRKRLSGSIRLKMDHR